MYGYLKFIENHCNFYTFNNWLQIFFMEDAGFSFVDIPVQEEIKIYMRRAVQHFKSNGIRTAKAPIKTLQQSLEIGLSFFFTVEDIPLILRNPDNPKEVDSLPWELLKSLFGQSNYTFAGLFFCILLETNGFMSPSVIPEYVKQGEQLKQELLVRSINTYFFLLKIVKL